MHITIAKVHENIFQGEAQSLTVPTTEGVVTILPHHEPLVATLKEGEAIVRSASGEQKFNVSSGVVEVSGNQVTVLL
jgi:F-type H+-transporting ATPase subunit epsilon